ncbi:MAG TPA: DUF4234 domain-containing protein [Candidatus Saccharimonadales bacterium]|nr:DUF4234 domain-containing protein [Candidatus Saccharimonadales bacterium]
MSWAENLRRVHMRRSESDYKIDYALNLLLTLLTCFLWGFVGWYRIVRRRDLHFARSADFTASAVAALAERADTMGKRPLVESHLRTLDVIARDLRTQARERGALVWVLLGIITAKVAFLLMFYFLEEDYRRQEQTEVEFAQHMGEALRLLGLPCGQAPFQPCTRDRSYALYLILTLLTCGLFGFYWFYRVNEEENCHMDAHAAWETELLGCLAGGPQGGPGGPGYAPYAPPAAPYAPPAPAAPPGAPGAPPPAAPGPPPGSPSA